ncbi:MAG: twin-arginine translocase subunit TatC [Chloroflexi bacterium]|nr:twin-arginine translocase subunit TatC [Chloroflexota bacterium]
MSSPTQQDEKRMSFWEHVQELRTRVIWASVAILVGLLVGLVLVRPFLELLISPLGTNRPQSLRPAENIMVYFKVDLVLALLLAMPVIVYQFFAFILPGLTPRERRLVLTISAAAAVLFALGVAFASFVMLPFTLGYLQSFLSDLIQPNYSIDFYISFVTQFVFYVGLSFETPLVIAALAWLGILSPQQLRRGRRYAIVLIAVLAAVITPTPDPFNMTIVMIPLILLYELGIILARFTYRPRPSYSSVERDSLPST